MYSMKKEIADINIKIDSLQNLMLKLYNQNKPTEQKKEPKVYPILQLDKSGSFESVKLSELKGKTIINDNGDILHVQEVRIIENIIVVDKEGLYVKSSYAHFVTYFKWLNGNNISLIIDRD